MSSCSCVKAVETRELREARMLYYKVWSYLPERCLEESFRAETRRQVEALPERPSEAADRLQPPQQ